MKNSKLVSTELACHLKLSKRLCPSTEKEKGEMSVIPYSSAIGSMLCVYFQIYLMQLEL